MATLGTNYVTLADAGNLFRGATSVAPVAETLSEENAILRHAVWEESSENFSHQHVQTLALPTVNWRKVNNGVTATAGAMKPISEPILISETRSEVDESIVDGARDPMAVRDRYLRLHVMGMAQEAEDKFFYGNKNSNPEQPHGIASRYNDPSAQSNVGDEGDSGSGASTSLWIIQWDLMTGAYLTYPNGSPLGIEVIDKDLERVSGAGSGQFYAYTHQVKLRFGIAVADSRGVQRLGSIDPVYGQSNDLEPNNILIRLGKMKSTSRAGIYVNRDIYTQINIEAVGKANVYYIADSPYGDGRVPHIQGVPIYLAEGIVSTEDAI